MTHEDFATISSPSVGFLAAATAALMAAFAAPTLPAIAQGLNSEGAIETIVGSDVGTAETDAKAERGRVETAIARSLDSAMEVRKRFRLDKVEIVFLPALKQGDEGFDAKLEEYSEQVRELRTAIEGSAMFYHALDSRSVPLRDVVGLEFSGDDVTIFAAGERPAQ